MDVNSAAIDCYGYSLREFMELTLADIRPEGEITPLMKEIEDVRSDSERIYSGVFKHCKSNGEEFDVRIYSNPITFKGRICRQVVAFDISELDQAYSDHRITKRQIQQNSVDAEPCAQGTLGKDDGSHEFIVGSGGK